MDIPCFSCKEECEAKEWIARAKGLSEAGIEVTKINLPCPKNKMTYTLSLRTG